MRYTLRANQWHKILRQLMHFVEKASNGDEIVVRTEALKVLGETYRESKYPELKITWIVEEQ